MKAKKFHFSLEALYKIRKIEEEKALQDLGKSLQKVNKAKETLANLENQYRIELQKIKELSKESSIQVFQNFAFFLKRIENMKKDIETLLVSMQPEIEEKTKAVLEARKKRRILEILKDKQYIEYINELKKLEKKELYEINNLQQKSPSGVEEAYDKKHHQLDFRSQKQKEEDYRSRKERELREYYRRKGIPV